MESLRKAVADLGSSIVETLRELGQISILCLQVAFWISRGRLPVRQVLVHMNEIGVNSLPLIAITSLFAGMVLVVQVGKQFLDLKAETFIGGTVGLSLTRELAPLLTALAVSGRSGSAIAAELGTMKVTEQIDALVVMATSPIAYLVVPRVIACALVMPCLTIFSETVGILGGAVVAVAQVRISSDTFSKSIVDWVQYDDVVSGVVKAFVFGIIIAIISSYKGLKTSGGAEGVGRATTASVVLITGLLLVTNYFLSVLFFSYKASLIK
ncbi:MAG: ABC transporter permease [Candidatus Wallbacteria bacterium]|nr:ABC transporter permease [Candidatus Wallbacteria bacterium]MBI4867766.1 ABC transporter permease [Candidatus Wallbacteria bacterium]